MPRDGIKLCKRCGQEFLKDGNYTWCIDCRDERAAQIPLQQLGAEDLVKHFSQDIGDRLQRMKWGHFN